VVLDKLVDFNTAKNNNIYEQWILSRIEINAYAGKVNEILRDDSVLSTDRTIIEWFL